MHPAIKQYLTGKIDLSPEHEELVSSCFKPKNAKRNEILVSRGAIARHMYWVLKGCLRVYLTREDGNESTRFLIFEGHGGTAFPSFILRQPSTAAIQSLGSSELLTLSYEDRQTLFRQVPGWERMEHRALELDYIASIQRIESFITIDSKTRYLALLENNPEIIKRLPARIVADYLGISQETLSRLKARK